MKQGLPDENLPHLYLDFETFLSAPGMQVPPQVCASYAEGAGEAKLLHANFDKGPLRALLDFYVRHGVIVAYAGAQMEWISILASHTDLVDALFLMLEEGRFVDPYLNEKLIRIAKGDGREVTDIATVLSENRIPHNIDKSNRWRVRYGELWDVPVCQWPLEAIEYSLGDVAVRDLYACQKAYAHFLLDAPAQVRAAASFALTTAWGFPVDLRKAEELQAATEAQIEEDRKLLLTTGLVKAEAKKGEVVFVRKKAPAEELITQAYADMGRPAPRSMPTPTMLAKAYREAGQEPPTFGKALKSFDLDKATKAGVPVPEGNISLDEEACNASQHPTLEAYTRYGQANTLLTKIERAVRAGRAKQPVQASYNPLVNTGRSSCRQGQDPEPGWGWSSYGMQVQNQGREGGTRECFVATGYDFWLDEHPDWREALLKGELPEWCIVSVDFDAFEMRTWAQCCLNILGYSSLADILNNPERCPHIEMGTMLYRKTDPSKPDWARKYAWGYELKKTDRDLLKKVRGLAKGPNFGLPGGMGASRLVDYCWLNYGIAISLEEAEFACRVWREIYPEAQPYLDHISTNILSSRTRGAKGQLTQFVSGRVRGGVGFCDASNGFFQGLAADAAKAAGWALAKEAYCNGDSPFYGSRPLAFVHDEWLYAVRRRNLHKAAYRMRDIMVATAQAYCPQVLISASPAASYRWSKKAGDPCHTEQGELIPYEEYLVSKG